MTNRLLYTAIALALVGLSALVLEQKRKGRWFGFDAFKTRFIHRKNLCEE